MKIADLAMRNGSCADVRRSHGAEAAVPAQDLSGRPLCVVPLRDRRAGGFRFLRRVGAPPPWADQAHPGRPDIALADLSNGNGLALVDGPSSRLPRRRGRIALQTPSGQRLSVGGSGKAGEVRLTSQRPGDAETFQWIDLERGDTLFLALATRRCLVGSKTPGPIAAGLPGPAPDRKDGSCVTWRIVR